MDGRFDREVQSIVWEWVRCPLCGADEPRRLVTDTLWRRDLRLSFTVVACRGCGLAYTNPRAHAPLLQREPGGAARTDAAVANRPIYAAGLAWLERLGLPSAGRLLDVGCARGDFLTFSAGRGYQAVGLDINPRLAAEAQARGHEVYVGDLREVDADALLGAPFDGVTLWDVLEHVDAPVALLASCRARLRPGGLLLVHTGNARFQIPKARLLHGLWPKAGPYLIPYQHLTHFDPRTAKLALRLAGLEPVAVTFAATLHYRQPWKRRAMALLNGLAAVPHRLGGPLLTNAMLVIGRRAATLG